jgi:tetratricopeptide (TPR) repeat protein
MAHPGRLDELNRKFDENPRRYFAPLANEFRKAGELARAIELCRSYLPHQPGHMSGYIVYGQSLFDAGRLEEASEIFHQALNLDPENLIALRHLGDISRAEGDKTQAMQWYKRVRDLDPKNEEITAFITDLAAPGTFTPPPAKPPAIRPEPEPDPAAVTLADLMEEPDTHQPPIEAATVFAYHQESEHLFEMAPLDASIEPADLYPGMDEEEAAEQVGAMEQSFREEEPEDEGPDEFPVASSPFVTETMAALYVQQGFTAEALDVYRKLAAIRDEPRLHGKIRELEVRLADETSERATSEPESVPSSGETVREFFARIGARHPADQIAEPPVAEPEGIEPQATSGLGALFGAAQVDARDAQAADSLAGAFSTLH